MGLAMCSDDLDMGMMMDEHKRSCVSDLMATYDPGMRDDAKATVTDNVRSMVEAGVSEVIPVDSCMSNMVLSGAKGNISNLAQIHCMVGQQYVLGKMPHGLRDDDPARSRGFCYSSYMAGLDPCEYMYHQMAGREGVVRTNVSTAKVGYISRRVIKAMASVRIGYNGSVFNESRVLSTHYGLDHTMGGIHVTMGILGNTH